MIGNYPITWLVTEIISVVLFVACLLHAMNQPNAKARVLELLCFLIGAAIFEHAGVLLSKQYDYDQHRILMTGIVPLSTLMIEAVILYTGMIVFEHFDMPKWSAIWVVGLYASFQDMGIDPVYVHDRYMFNGVLSGQWNWHHTYANAFFGIPFFNFSGWLYMTGIYAALIYLGRWVHKKYQNDFVAVMYPLLSGLLLIIPFSLVGFVLITGQDRTGELVRMIVNLIIPVILVAIYWKGLKPLDLKKDRIVFIVTIVLDLYNLIVGFGLGIKISYIPITVVAVLHFAFLYYLYTKAKHVDQEEVPLEAGA